MKRQTSRYDDHTSIPRRRSSTQSRKTRSPFEPVEHVHQAVKAFERYDLVSAPVVDDRGKLVGRLTVDTVMDLARDEADLRALKRAWRSAW